MRIFVAVVLSIASLSFLAGSSLADTPASAYHVIKKIPVEGDKGWDYLSIDAAGRRLYITRADHVTVVDIDSDKVVGEVTAPEVKGIHGVALVPDLNRGFISNGMTSTVTPFDLKTLKTDEPIKVGNRPDAIIYDPASKRVFSFNAGSKDATAIDAETKAVAGTVPLGGQPEFAVADEQGQVYVNIEDKNEIVAFDARELKEKNRWKVAPGTEPAGLAMDRKQRRLFSTCHNQKMVVMDADNGNVIATPEIGKGTDACVFDQETGLAFSSNGDGTLTIVQQDASGTYQVAANVATQPGSRTMALDTKTHQIYLVTAKAKAGQRRVFEPRTFTILVVGKES
jgi:YVTN family beta-propeller protein